MTYTTYPQNVNYRLPRTKGEKYEHMCSAYFFLTQCVPPVQRHLQIVPPLQVVVDASGNYIRDGGRGTILYIGACRHPSRTSMSALTIHLRNSISPCVVGLRETTRRARLLADDVIKLEGARGHVRVGEHRLHEKLPRMQAHKHATTKKLSTPKIGNSRWQHVWNVYILPMFAGAQRLFRGGRESLYQFSA